ncbi:MAG TPA: DUF6529 family protein [Solirubrobacterales bacterium]|nr:DUF6529 family protein [Solirubrobacterales bacterium]
MEDLIDELTRGNVTEVKVVLASVILALAVYQLLLAAIAYGRLRLPFLESATASWTHRASGDTIVVLTIFVATACIAFYGFEDGGAHAVFGTILLGAIALKILAVRIGGRVSRLLPIIGISVLTLFGLTWVTSAGDFFGMGG